MIITKNLESVSHAFDENIIKFNEVGAVKAKVEVDIDSNTYEFVIYSIDDNFEFDFYHIFKLANSHNFEDNFDYLATGADARLSKEVIITLTTYDANDDLIDDEIIETVVLLSVNQLEDEQKQVGVVQTDVFKGYPFDVSTYIEQQVDIVIGSITETITEVNKVIRVPLIDEDGSENYTLETGINLIDVQNEEGSILKIEANYHDNCKGFYLKWFNKFGAWDYWLFPFKHEVNVTDKEIGRLTTRDNENSNGLTIGKEYRQTHNLQADFLNQEQWNKLFGLIATPKAYLWTGEKFIEVYPIARQNYIYSRQNQSFQVEIELPTRRTQRL